MVEHCTIKEEEQRETVRELELAARSAIYQSIVIGERRKISEMYIHKIEKYHLKPVRKIATNKIRGIKH